MDKGKLTPVVQKRIVDAIKAGNYVCVAVRYAGITSSTFYTWCRKGRAESSGKYHEFYEALRQAETYAEIRAVAIIQKQMEGNWRAAVAYLERKFPERWGRKEPRDNWLDRVRASRKAGKDESHDESRIAQIARVLDEVGALDASSGETSRAPEK